MGLLSKQARKHQATAQVDSLILELKSWQEDWTTRDRHHDGSPRGQYQTQLAAVYGEVHAAALLLKDSLGKISLEAPATGVYGAYARAEREILWLWRIFYFFRDKFEQRLDPRYSAILKAADEVVWSCHRPFFDLPALKKQVRVPAPLPYIKPAFSPAALRLDQANVLDSQDKDFLVVREAFKNLPVPLMSIPITAIQNPWALVLIGHEAGHVLERLIEPGFEKTFRNAITEAVAKSGYAGDGHSELREADQGQWSGWADEIFADVYSILTMGPWAVWAMSQFEAAEDTQMAARRYVYPAPCVRLRLMASIANRYGLMTEIPETPVALPDPVVRDLGYVEAVADAIVALPGIQALAAPLAFDAVNYTDQTPDGRFCIVKQWSRHLSGVAASPQTREVRSARMAAAGAAKVWAETVFENETIDSEKLRATATEKIGATGPFDVRSSTAAPKSDRPAGEALFDVLKRVDMIVEEPDARTD